MPIPLIVAEFDSADEINKIWNDDTFILYNQIKCLMSKVNISLTLEQKDKLFPEIPDYAIINNKVYKLEENSHLEWTSFRDVDSSSYCEIELNRIYDKNVADNIIRRYYE